MESHKSHVPNHQPDNIDNNMEEEAEYDMWVCLKFGGYPQNYTIEMAKIVGKPSDLTDTSSSDKPMTKDTTEQVFSMVDFTNCSKFWGKNEEHQQICCHKNSDTTCYHNHNSNFTCWISQFFMGCIIPLVASFSMDLGKL